MEENITNTGTLHVIFNSINTHTHTHTQTPLTFRRPSLEAMVAVLRQKPWQLVRGLHHSTACKAKELTAIIQT